MGSQLNITDMGGGRTDVVQDIHYIGCRSYWKLAQKTPQQKVIAHGEYRKETGGIDPYKEDSVSEDREGSQSLPILAAACSSQTVTQILSMEDQPLPPPPPPIQIHVVTAQDELV